MQDIEKLGGADIIIETGVTLEDRGELFRKLAPLLGKDRILGLQCLVEPIKELALSLENPERVMGLNFQPPVKENKLVEIARTDKTSDEGISAAVEFLKNIGKTAVVLSDSPGFALERISRAFILSAISMVEAGKGLPRQIDGAFKKTCRSPMGPFETADSVGLDVDYEKSEKLYKLLGQPLRLKPSASENRLVQFGQNGKKSTAGFYLYDEGKIAGENPLMSDLVPYLGITSLKDEEIAAQIIQSVSAEARLISAEAKISEFDIETAVKIGLGWPKGPFAFERDFENIIKQKLTRREGEWPQDSF
ncbi:MAG: 3-hydroxyacyl-CoA dehydrogenase family protein [Elusimicrobia bacterium]|nr:3-hydroxyacyl-CoA dehydrogenase family protein [Elusimicrobiota bacterium]